MKHGRSRVLFWVCRSQLFILSLMFGVLFGEESFFRDLFISSMILEEPVGYTITGEKPVSFIVTPKLSSVDLPYLRGIEQKRSALVRGYLEFKQWIEACNSPGYLFLFNEDDDVLVLTVINKASFKERCREAGIDEESTLSRLELNRGDLERAFLGRHDLIGIFLGFGVHNSALFQNEVEGEMKKTSLIKEFPLYYYNRSRLPSRLGNFSNERECLVRAMLLPAFMADPSSEETKLLREQYCSDRRKVLKELDKGAIQEVFYNHCMRMDE